MSATNSRHGNKGGALIPVKDLVLDPSIDNSIAQSLSFYSVTAATPPYPRHVFSPARTGSGGHTLSRELRNRFQQLDDEDSKYTDTLSLDRGAGSPLSPLSPAYASNTIHTESDHNEDKGLHRHYSGNEMSYTNSHSSPKSDKSSPKSKAKRYSPMVSCEL
jgi:hypothetical protein